MTGPLIETKLHFPRRGPRVVARSRLIERVQRGTETRLTLVSAPPGFGKSTLIGDWVGSPRIPLAATAWVSLDPGDNDPAMFWAYALAALRRAAINVGADGSPFDPEQAFDVGTLVNNLAALPTEIVLVLDDYHVIEAQEVHDALADLLERLPAQVHVVVATRSDPPLHLSRLRARAELVEIRAADLRFTVDEAADYLNGAVGLGLTDSDVAALESRTEGWIAAIQLSALSMEGRDDVSAFIASFAGDDRYVVDYLVDEVLRRQPERTRTFLAQTSILNQMTGPLCDAVTGQNDGRAMLEALERANLFLVPLDDRRRWYRYHHLFGAMLRARLLDEYQDLVPVLHKRASIWHERHGEQPEAIRHALDAQDFERAADLIEVAAQAMIRNRQEVTLRRWLDALPDEIFAARPVLAMAHVGALLSTSELQGVEARLADAERWVGATQDEHARVAAVAAGMIVRHTELLGHLPSAIALHRSGLARMRGDLPGTIAYARTALEVAQDDQPLERGGAAGLLGLAYWTIGDLEVAHEAWSEALVNLEQAGHHADMLGCFMAMADIRIAQGRLADARRTYERGLRLGAQAGKSPLRGAADMHVGLSELYREWNDLTAAKMHLDASTELGEAMGLPQNAYRSRVAAARLLEARGDLDGAIQSLDDAERVYVSDFFPDTRPISAVRARVWLGQGRWGDALAWAAERGVSVDDGLTYIHEFEHIILARALLIRAQKEGGLAAAERASALLARLLDAADAGGRRRSVLEILVLQALASHAAGERGGAAEAIGRALEAAEPEAYVRIFADEGPGLVPLLRAAAKGGRARDYAGRLMAAFDGRSNRPVTRQRQPLIERLSDRELEVLRLLATELDGPGIARQLVVSLNTMRTHTKNIYAKLGVNSRRAAVLRASELKLLAWTRDH
ncbi:MAG: LuxR C-terminal-related transcriptional regulator [Chloroflexota bacterium]